jgi:uncharacterized membrane protein YcjF (UPF0283 family)
MGFFNEIDALKDHALEPFQNEPGKRRFVQIVFVLLCAAVGVGVAWLMGNWTSSPWSLFGYALAIVLLSIFAAIWAIARSSRNYRRYRGLCQNFANCSRVLMTKNSSARSRKSRSSMIWNDGFSVNHRQLSTNCRLTLTVAPYYCPSGSSSVNLAGICPPLSLLLLP